MNHVHDLLLGGMVALFCLLGPGLYKLELGVSCLYPLGAEGGANSLLFLDCEVFEGVAVMSPCGVGVRLGLILQTQSGIGYGGEEGCVVSGVCVCESLH